MLLRTLPNPLLVLQCMMYYYSMCNPITKRMMMMTTVHEICVRSRLYYYTVDGLFQLRLNGVDICTQWYITKVS